MKTKNDLLRLLILLSALFLSIPMYAEKKVALLIGNSTYDQHVHADSTYNLKFADLPPAINDASTINDILQSLGFQTILVKDGDRNEMLDALHQFSDLSKNADVSVYFYSGHATRIEEDLYLIPSKTAFQPYYLSEQLIRVENIKNSMRSNSKLSLLFFDACRSEILIDDSIKKDKGKLIMPDIGSSPKINVQNPWIAYYATRNGKTASAGTETLSPFTQVLAKHLSDGEEFNHVFYTIINEVKLLTHDQQEPTNEGCYSGGFYFNPTGKKVAVPTPTSQPKENKKAITVFANVPHATIDFYGKKYDTGKPLLFEIGKNYAYTVNAEGYQPYSGIITASSTASSSISVTLSKGEPATFTIYCNTAASVYYDNKHVGVTKKDEPLKIATISGKHQIKLSAKGYNSYFTDIVLKVGDNNKKFSLEKRIGEFWKWDSYEKTNSLSYHYSPQYQIGLSYMYRPENSRFSFGAILSASTGWFKGIKTTDTKVFASTGISTTITVDNGSGQLVKYLQTTTSTGKTPDRYSEKIDPDQEAKKYDANAMILANVGFNPCNGITIEAGIGTAYHQDRYHLPFAVQQTKTIMTDLNTGEIVGKPTYQYERTDGSEWIKQKAKWSPALRLGAKTLIPLDGWDQYFLSIGGGYTFLLTHSKYSSWDTNIGIVWEF